jgi:ATP-binding cassette subfamily F protein 3
MDAALATLFAADPGKAAVVSKERAEAAAKLRAAEEEWLQASADYDAAAA